MMMAAIVRKKAIEMSTACGGIPTSYGGGTVVDAPSRLMMVSEPSRPRILTVRPASGGVGAAGCAFCANAACAAPLARAAVISCWTLLRIASRNSRAASFRLWPATGAGFWFVAAGLGVVPVAWIVTIAFNRGGVLVGHLILERLLPPRRKLSIC